MQENIEQKECHGLTHDENKAIIAQFAARETDECEQNAAQWVLRVQVIVTLIVCLIIFIFKQEVSLVLAVLCGGGASIVNILMLAWRMRKSSAQVTLDAHIQLRLLYYYAAERFLVVVMALAVCIMVLKLSPLYVICGFLVGQVALIATRLVLTRSK